MNLKPNAMGLVPVKMLISEAGLGLRKDEVRGVTPGIAEKLIANKQAELVDVAADKATKIDPKA